MKFFFQNFFKIKFQDGTKVFSASADKTVKMWDLASNQQIQVAQHDQPVKTCHFIKAPNYTCLMTTSFDKTIKVSVSISINVFSFPDRFFFHFSFGIYVKPNQQ